MTTISTLDVIYENWRAYHEKLRNCIEPLTNEQLMLRPAARMWPLGQIVQHIISVRAGWFSGTLQDDAKAMSAYMEWGHLMEGPIAEKFRSSSALPEGQDLHDLGDYTVTWNSDTPWLRSTLDRTVATRPPFPYALRNSTERTG